MKSRLTALLTAFGLLLAVLSARADYHVQGYRYLSPVPEAEYCSAQTRLVLVRFDSVSMVDVTGTRAYDSPEVEFKGDNNRFRLISVGCI